MLLEGEAVSRRCKVCLRVCSKSTLIVMVKRAKSDLEKNIVICGCAAILNVLCAHVTVLGLNMTNNAGSIRRLINLTAQHSACPCHRCTPYAHGPAALNQLRKFATPVHAVQKEYAFEVRSQQITPLPSPIPSSQGRCFQPQVWRGCHPRGRHGSQEYESTQGNSPSYLSSPLLHLCYSRLASSRIRS